MSYEKKVRKQIFFAFLNFSLLYRMDSARSNSVWSICQTFLFRCDEACIIIGLMQRVKRWPSLSPPCFSTSPSSLLWEKPRSCQSSASVGPEEKNAFHTNLSISSHGILSTFGERQSLPRRGRRHFFLRNSNLLFKSGSRYLIVTLRVGD